MAVDRRKFVKLAGLGILGVAASPSGKIFASEGHGNVIKGEDLESAEAVASPCAGCKDNLKDRLLDEINAALKREKRSWGILVDLRKYEASDWSKSIEACHSIHNVPDFDGTKDELKWIWEDSFHHAMPEQANNHLPANLEHTSTPLLCNHCDEPPCTRVCPTRATWKREEDGVVMMDWHRCIGCRYCIAGCPYGSRSFNYREPWPDRDDPKIKLDYPTRTKGVVEKCTLCEERLVKGKLPACVEACDNGTLIVGDLLDPKSTIRKMLGCHFSLRRKPALGTQPKVYYIV